MSLTALPLASVKPSSFKQGINLRFGAPEAPVKRHRVIGAAGGEDILPERPRRFPVKKAGFLEGLESIGIQYFGPDIAVVS